jgi:hypothetical protein
MSFKKNAGTLAKMVTLICAAYLPQAHADYTHDFGTINAPVIETLGDSNLTSASFTDTWFFNINAGANVGSAIISYSYTVDSTDPNELGASLSAVNLENANASAIISQGTVTNTTVGPDSNGFFTTTYSGLLASTQLQANTGYSIVISGQGGTYETQTSYSGFLQLETATAASTPEPEQWAMLLLGLPLIGWVSRGKQNPLREASLA